MSPRSSAPSPAFYRARHLGPPTEEITPEGADQFCEALDDLHHQTKPWTIVGDGQHIRRSLTDQVVLRTQGLADVLDVDPISGVVRVGAGTTWRHLQDQVNQGGFSLQRYDLYPPSATVGGLLARRRPGPPLLRGGSLLDGCAGLGAHQPAGQGYRYLTAPRKAAGPDLRHLFAGNDGGQGAILEASLVAFKPVSQRLLRFDACDLGQVKRLIAGLFQAGIDTTWIHYKLANQVLQIALTAPGQLLRHRVQWITDHLQPPDAIGDDQATQTRRRWLEARHPDRREHPRATHTRVFAVLPAALTRGPDELFGPGTTDAEFIHWTPRRTLAFVRYDQPLAASDDHRPPAGTCWAHWPLLPT